MLLLLTLAALFGAFVNDVATSRDKVLVPTAAYAAMDMSSHASKSAADREMARAMRRMAQSMAATKMTGDVDRDFMAMMIPHHQAAIDMANVELRTGKEAHVLTLAHNIVAAQQREIADMRSWLHGRRMDRLR